MLDNVFSFNLATLQSKVIAEYLRKVVGFQPRTLPFELEAGDHDILPCLILGEGLHVLNIE